MSPGSDPRHALVHVVDLRSGAAHVIRGLRWLMPNPPAWSSDSRTLALGRLRGDAITVPASGGSLHRLGAPGIAVDWDGAGGLVMVGGKRGGDVWVSGGGEPARFLFGLPDKRSFATIDAD